MRLRTLPPAAAPVDLGHLLRGVLALRRGPRALAALAQEMRDYLGVRHVFFTGSGTAALALALSTLAARSGRRRVIIPGYTCFSVPSAAAKLGLAISPCDVVPDTLDFDFRHLERLVGPDTLCVVATHLLGLPSALDRVIPLCRERGAFVIEDAAQGMGGRYRGRRLGTLGDVGILSFGRGKNVTCGAGGMVVTDDEPLGAALRAAHARLATEPIRHVLRNLATVLAMRVLLHPRLYGLPARLPFLHLGETRFLPDFPVHRLHPLKAALLWGWRERLVRSNRARRARALRWRSLPPGLRRVRTAPGAQPAYLRLPLIAATARLRDELCARAAEEGLGLSALYPTPVHRIPELAGTLGGLDLPGADAVAARLLTFPVHPLVGADDQARLQRLVDGLAAPPERGGALGVPRPLARGLP